MRPTVTLTSQEIASPVHGGVGGVGHNKIRSRIKRTDSDEEEFDDDFLFEPIVLSLSSKSIIKADDAPRGSGMLLFIYLYLFVSIIFVFFILLFFLVILWIFCVYYLSFATIFKLFLFVIYLIIFFCTLNSGKVKRRDCRIKEKYRSC